MPLQCADPYSLVITFEKHGDLVVDKTIVESEMTEGEIAATAPFPQKEKTVALAANINLTASRLQDGRDPLKDLTVGFV